MCIIGDSLLLPCNKALPFYFFLNKGHVVELHMLRLIKELQEKMELEKLHKMSLKDSSTRRRSRNVI